jgi:phosphatidylglycerol:prolipoprotein diacylglycerol transferase
VKPIPVSFHIGPLLVHTYGIGLAITFWFAYRYFDRRLRANGYETRWLTGMFLWVVVAAIVGARLVHVLSDLSYYSSNPREIFSVWHGGLSSFGGLLLGVPTGVLIARHRCPELGVTKGLDLVAPVLMAAWGIGRLLGPQLMFAGGGARTAAWYGMYYAGEQGRRVPVPIIQSVDSFVIFGILLLIERRYRERPGGFVLAATAALWGLARFFEEFVFLRQSSPQGSLPVEVAGLVLFGAGVTAMVLLWRRQRREADGATATAVSPANETGRATPPAAASLGPVRPDTAANPRSA